MHQPVRVHIVTHVPFEGPENIRNYFIEKQATFTYTEAYNSDPFPTADAYDFLVVMGGPMGVSDEDRYPWLRKEKTFIKQGILSGKRAIGVCLGAQLLAESLGATVSRMAEKEIGWFDIEPSGSSGHLLEGLFTDRTTVFHWHGDTFSCPEGAASLAKSEVCASQGFIYDNRIVGLQFHIEMTPESVAKIITHGQAELVPGPYIQNPEEMLAESQAYDSNRKLLWQLLDQLTEKEES